jgi:hypothetical protein
MDLKKLYSNGHCQCQFGSVERISHGYLLLMGQNIHI